MNHILFFISNNIVLTAIWFFFFCIIIFFIFRSFYLKTKIINNFDAIELINKKNAIIIDTRSLELYNLGHILNSIHIPLKNISIKKIKELNLSIDCPIIIIINPIENSNKYIKVFIKYGINNIYILNNGMDSWNKENLPIFKNKNNNSCKF